MFYRHEYKLKSLKQLKKKTGKYIQYYNKERTKKRLNSFTLGIKSYNNIILSTLFLLQNI